MRRILSRHHDIAWPVYALILLLAGGVGTLAAPRDPTPLMFVSTPWPPFTNEAGRPRFALDLVEAAFARFGLTTKTTIVPPAEFTPGMLNGRFDGSAAAWKDAERERVLLFSQPYLENRLVLVGRRGMDVSAKSFGDLTGKRVAIVDGYAYGDAVDKSGPVFVRSSSEEDSVTRLMRSDVDYTLMDELVVQYLVANYPKESQEKLAIGSTPLLVRELYVAVRRTRPDAESIIARFNAQLRDMIADRTYHRLLHVDWIRADINGDGIPDYVPASDRPGPAPPEHSYALFSTPEPVVTQNQGKTGGFYVGGTLYGDWASVPESYKEVNPQFPDPRRASASVFRFTW